MTASTGLPTLNFASVHQEHKTIARKRLTEAGCPVHTTRLKDFREFRDLFLLLSYLFKGFKVLGPILLLNVHFSQ